jgi:hypothetical protein
MTLRQRNLVRVYLGIKDNDIITDDDIDVYLDQAAAQDWSIGDDYCIALMACSLITQSNMWQAVKSEESGLTIDTSDTFKRMLEDRLTFLGKNDMMISQETYETEDA